MQSLCFEKLLRCRSIFCKSAKRNWICPTFFVRKINSRRTITNQPFLFALWRFSKKRTKTIGKIPTTPWWAIQVQKFVLAQNVCKMIYVFCWVGCHFVMQRDSFTLWATFGPEMRWLKMQNVHDNFLLNFQLWGLWACSSFIKLILCMVLNGIEFAVNKFHQMFSNENICKVTKAVSIILNPPGGSIK